MNRTRSFWDRSFEDPRQQFFYGHRRSIEDEDYEDQDPLQQFLYGNRQSIEREEEDLFRMAKSRSFARHSFRQPRSILANFMEELQQQQQFPYQHGAEESSSYEESDFELETKSEEKDEEVLPELDAVVDNRHFKGKQVAIGELSSNDLGNCLLVDFLNKARIHLPQLTSSDGNCLFHSACKREELVQEGDEPCHRAHDRVITDYRHDVGEVMRDNFPDLQKLFSHDFEKYNIKLEYDENNTFGISREGWNKYIKLVQKSRIWSDSSQIAALAKVLDEPILVIERKLNLDGQDTDSDSLMDYFSFTFYNHRNFKSERFYKQQSDVEQVLTIIKHWNPVVVYFNGINHFSRCEKMYSPSEFITYDDLNK